MPKFIKFFYTVVLLLSVNPFLLSYADQKAEKDITKQCIGNNLHDKYDSSVNEDKKKKILCAGRGCCSWHKGQCGCDKGTVVCCDGTYSPSCGC